MKCEQVKELLSAYLDGQLVADTYQRITCHIRHCRSCSDILADFRYLDTLLAQMPRVEPDASLHTRIFPPPAYRSSDIYIQPLQRPTPSLTLPPFARVGRPHLIALPGGRGSHHPALTVTPLEEERTTDKIAIPPITALRALITSQHAQIRLPFYERLESHRPHPLIIATFICAIILAFLAGLFIGIHL